MDGLSLHVKMTHSLGGQIPIKAPSYFYYLEFSEALCCQSVEAGGHVNHNQTETEALTSLHNDEVDNQLE